MAGVNMPDRIGELLLGVLARKTVEELLVVVDIAGDHVEVQPLRRLGLAIHEQRQRFRRRIAQPFADGEAIALRFGNLLAPLVEEQFVIEAFGRCAAERGANPARQLDRIDQVLASHFIIYPEREPAHRPVGLPLAFYPAAGDRSLGLLAGVRINITHRAFRHVALDHRYVEHFAAGWADWQEWRIGRAPLRSERWQDNLHHPVIDLEY